jgi:hypothetical protein
MIQQIDALDIKLTVERNRCTDHGARPNIKLTENGMTIICCCDRFQAECSNLAKELAQLLTLTDLIIE